MTWLYLRTLTTCPVYVWKYSDSEEDIPSGTWLPLDRATDNVTKHRGLPAPGRPCKWIKKSFPKKNSLQIRFRFLEGEQRDPTGATGSRGRLSFPSSYIHPFPGPSQGDLTNTYFVFRLPRAASQLVFVITIFYWSSQYNNNFDTCSSLITNVLKNILYYIYWGLSI